MEALLPFIARHIELVEPKLIALVGGTAANAMLHRSEGITKLRGKWFDWQNIPTIAIYHPAYLLRHLKGCLARIRWVAQGGVVR